ncbi:MAG TPA: TIGR03960 family B12-binding radical SAM protein [Polyangiaceae bacterium]|nr:TIGR03960 family B12-binding radical SAM protein [Polyangiaceae bacterium]
MPKLFDHPYAAILPRVEKPSRYTGGEHGVRRKEWAPGVARVCLAFPDIYDIGMSHLGYRILYKILNDDPRTLAERAYTPWVDMQRELRNEGLLLLSLESARPLSDFDVVGFSLQYELTYTNVLTMLDLGGIPLRAANRGDDDPLVIAGGPVATHAEPLAAFVDAFLVGDGESAATEIAVAWAADRRAGVPRAERLRKLAALRGVYVPSLYETAPDPETGFHVVSAPKDPGVPFPVERRIEADLSKFPFPDDGPVGGPEAIFDRMSIEVARGCTEGCRFCQAGMIYRPVRERDPKEVIDTVLSALEKSGQDEVSLTALSTADVSSISPLIQRLVEKTAPERVSLGVASLRAYGLSPELLDDMRRVRTSGLTFAPEAGTQRMRDVINKNVTEEQLMETANRVFSRGFDSMKLYFIIGLPTEEDDDVRGIVNVGKNALAVGKRVSRSRPKVTVSVSSHVPKPHTPFQWCAMDSLEEISRKQQILKDEARGVRGLSLRTHDSTTSVLEGVLARGDRRLSDVIERAYLGGARFDSWDDQLRMDLWAEALQHFGIDTAPFLGTIPVTARLPWDHLDVGLEEGFLAREYRKALASRLSPPCGKAKGMFVHHTNVKDADADPRRLVCYDCGIACDLGKMRNERIEFLTRVDAKEPGGRARLPVFQPKEEDAGKRIAPEAYRPPQAGGEPERFRLRFEKTGPAALLGHLDLIRELPRVIRRAGVRTAYTRGFHPKPDMTFSPALSLGIASLEEYLDVRLIGAPSEEELVERLNRVASAGVRFTAAVRLGPNDPRVTSLIESARYVVALARPALAALGGPSVAERIAAFEALPEIVVRRKTEGVGRDVEVKKYVTTLRVGAGDALAVIARAGIVGDLVPLDVRTVITGNGTVKIAEVVEALFGAPVPFKAVRAELGTQGASPMDLAAHRRPPPAPKRDLPDVPTFSP